MLAAIGLYKSAFQPFRCILFDNIFHLRQVGIKSWPNAISTLDNVLRKLINKRFLIRPTAQIA